MMKRILNRIGLFFIWLTCKMGIHVWYVARSQGVEIVRVCECCGKIMKKPKKEERE